MFVRGKRQDVDEPSGFRRERACRDGDRAVASGHEEVGGKRTRRALQRVSAEGIEPIPNVLTQTVGLGG